MPSTAPYSAISIASIRPRWDPTMPSIARWSGRRSASSSIKKSSAHTSGASTPTSSRPSAASTGRSSRWRISGEGGTAVPRSGTRSPAGSRRYRRSCGPRRRTCAPGSRPEICPTPGSCRTTGFRRPATTPPIFASRFRISRPATSPVSPRAMARSPAWGRRGVLAAPAGGRAFSARRPTPPLEIVETPRVGGSTMAAASSPAPPFKSAGIGRFYLSPSRGDLGVLKENNHHAVADLCAHEGFPGHDWHYQFMRSRSRAIGNVRWLTVGEVEGSASMWGDSMAAEGWALYAEQLMAEPQSGAPDGFYTPEERIYQIKGQLLRAARIRLDIGLHTGRMSFDEAVAYYPAKVGLLPGGF